MKHFALKITCAIAIVALTVLSLSNCMGGGDYPPPSDDTRYSSINLGTVPLSPNNEFWIKDDNQEVATFVYNGTEIKCKVAAHTIEETSYFLGRTVTEKGGEKLDSTFYVMKQSEAKGGNSLDLPIAFTEKRVKNLSGANLATPFSSLSQFAEVLELRVHNAKFVINFNNSDTSQTRFYPTLTLGQTTYDSVYHCYNKAANTIVQNELYYKLGVGIIGFRVINNELWIRK